MANWLLRIELGDLHESYRAGDIDASALAAAVKTRLEDFHPVVVQRFPFMAEEFATATELFDGVDDIDEYDDAMNALYDWGDTALDNEWPGKKLCWIDTSNPPIKASGKG